MNLVLCSVFIVWAGLAAEAKPHEERAKKPLYVAPTAKAHAPVPVAAPPPTSKAKKAEAAPPKPLPPIGVLGISTVTIRSPRAAALTQWYREKVALEPLFEDAGAHEFAVQDGSAFVVSPVANDQATAPPQIAVVRFEVANLRDAIEKLKARGVKPFITKAGVPEITEEPSLSYAFIQDPAGNWIQLAQRR